MSERSRKRARQDARRNPVKAVPPSQRPTTPAPASKARNAFRVARVQRQVAVQLPGIIREGKRDKVDRRPQGDLQPEVAPPPGPTEASRFAAARAERARSAQVSLEGAKPDPGKCRPKDNTPKKGGGSGREFHLWKKTC